MKKVGILMGSDSDLPVVRKATAILDGFGVPYEVHVYSAHRTPVEACEFAENASSRDFGVLICFAGMSAHLAGVVASKTILPVIGVPCKGPSFDGMDALLSTVMMPSGIPVATVAVDGGANGALLACQILALSDASLCEALKAKREADHQAVLAKNAKVELEFNK